MFFLSFLLLIINTWVCRLFTFQTTSHCVCESVCLHAHLCLPCLYCTWDQGYAMETRTRWPYFPRLDQPQKKRLLNLPPPMYYSCKRDEFNPPLQKRDSRALGEREEGRKQQQQQHADSGMNESVSVSLPKSNQTIRFILLTLAVRRSSCTGGGGNGARFMWLHFPLGEVCVSAVWQNCGMLPPVGVSSVYSVQLYFQLDFVSSGLKLSFSGSFVLLNCSVTWGTSFMVRNGIYRGHHLSGRPFTVCLRTGCCSHCSNVSTRSSDRLQTWSEWSDLHPQCVLAVFPPVVKAVHLWSDHLGRILKPGGKILRPECNTARFLSWLFRTVSNQGGCCDKGLLLPTCSSQCFSPLCRLDLQQHRSFFCLFVWTTI